MYIFMLQDLIPVKFTPVADRDDKTSLIAKGVSENLTNMKIMYCIRDKCNGRS